MQVRFTRHVKVETPAPLIELLAEKSELSKIRLKDCLNKGAVWLRRPGRKEQRVRQGEILTQTWRYGFALL